jgi:hypothetical protein
LYLQAIHSVDFVRQGCLGGRDFTLTLTGVKQGSIGGQKSIVWKNVQDERHSRWLRIVNALEDRFFTLILAEVKQSIILEN